MYAYYIWYNTYVVQIVRCNMCQSYSCYNMNILQCIFSVYPEMYPMYEGISILVYTLY
jgi:hypothetical protein